MSIRRWLTVGTLTLLAAMFSSVVFTLLLGDVGATVGFIAGGAVTLSELTED